MKTIISILLMGILLNGCITTRAAYEEKQRRQAQAQFEAEQEEKEYQARVAVMKPGTKWETFRMAMGAYSTFEFKNGSYYYYYNEFDDPKIFQFKNDKLVGWVDNHELARDRERENNERQRLNYQAEVQRRQNIANYLQQSSLQHQQNAHQLQQQQLNSFNNRPKQTDYTCMNNCSRMNYQYQYCQSRCSY